jgi:hypothetical protein
MAITPAADRRRKPSRIIRKVLLRQIAILNYVDPF